MDPVDELADLLQLHVNRDKVINLTCYALKLWGSTCNRQDLMTASARLASARASMRLYDDALALKTAVKYGLGTQDGPVWGPLGVAGGLSTLAYLQAEKLCWLIDTGILAVSKDAEFNVKTTHKLFWSLSAFFGFVRSIRSLHACSEALKSPERTKCASARFTQASLTTTKFLLDTIHAVSWLPPGWLWGSALSTQKASAIATTSAVLGLVIHYHGKRF
ncbi:peroxisomal membrane protein 11C-like [Anticarsia gemmatalis]|uniref:peroxisomal membrane protein 11C-like n=1 Tax=Anticarsia gemmatalis TaxID=129554 RepID=UPI003F76C1F7